MMRKFPKSSFLVIFLLQLISSITSTKNLSYGVGDIIRDGETVISENGIFVLGFFKANNGRSRYLGLWYNFSTDTIVWIANRENPITHSFGVLQLTGEGNLIIYQNQSTTNDSSIVWSSNSNNSNVVNPTAKLLNSGNLIISSSNHGTNDDDGFLWESFDYPTDTLLPEMKLGFNKKTGLQRYLTAWKQSNVDPSPSNFVMKMETTGLHEVYTLISSKNRKVVRLGSWNGEWFVGTPRQKTNSGRSFTYVDNQDEVYFKFNVTEHLIYERIVVFPNNSYWRLAKGINDTNSTWSSYPSNADTCDRYAFCGPNGICNLKNLTYCECFPGFRPKSGNSWIQNKYSMGCARNLELNCTDDEDFFLVNDVKTPETTNSTFLDKNLSIGQCKDRCISNCSCIAYAPVYLEIKNIPRGCIMWYGDLIDTVLFNRGDGQQLYLRMPKSELQGKYSRNGGKKIVTIVMVVVGVIIISLSGIVILIRKKKILMQRRNLTERPMLYSNEDDTILNEEVPLFDFLSIASSTNNFSTDNKIGQGGFGVVYKGTMENGQEIAVKRLSSSSGYELNDFMNEASLISKLRHRNLLQLLGCCMERDERILIYEFMKNKSLDKFIFGENRHLIEWPKRAEIIIGIARGLLYLHQDSGLRIIHRDLKPGNVLLDEAMNPKISDFGTARLFGIEQVEENTRRVIGTFGYMPPEYANGGIFSIKSDVFSFGVLLLEIISGKKNRVYYKYENDVNLLAQAWTLCKEQKSLMLLDECLCQSCLIPQVSRFIQIGLLCVQDKAIDRPTMSDVLHMLTNENSSIKDAKRSAFWNYSSDPNFEQVDSNNVASLTQLDGR